MTAKLDPLLQALAGSISQQKALQSLLGAIDFDDSRASYSSLRRVAIVLEQVEELAAFSPSLLTALADAASPDRAVINFERFLAAYDDKPALISSLVKEPRLTETLIILFAGSQFLTEILLRDPQLFAQIQKRDLLVVPKTRQQFIAEAEETAAADEDYGNQLDALRRFHRQELFRIGASDLMGLLNVYAIATQLTYLAVSLIRACLTVSVQQTRVAADGFSVLALGKLGGRELNYSSDIDLLFLGRETTSDYQRLGERLIEALTKVTKEGFLYRVDMRLRPWGQVGTLVPSLEENLRYLRESGQVWEKQAMYKGRIVAGNEILAIEFLQEVKRLIAEMDPETLRTEMKTMKDKMERSLRRRGRHWGEVKAGVGSIRDVEFVTQFLQQAHGKGHPEVHSRNTLDGLARLRASGILPINEYRTLAEGYTFLRSTEHHLQIMHHRQTHLLPTDSRELGYLARRLGYPGSSAENDFVTRFKQHSSAIREIYRQHILRDPKTKVHPEAIASESSDAPATAADRHLARLDTAYAVAFSPDEITLHVEMAGKLGGERPVQVQAERLSELDWRVTIVAFDYLGELSLICGLLFDYGLNIIEGNIFTYGPEIPSRDKVSKRSSPKLTRHKPIDSRRKIVDAFTVRSFRGVISDDVWLSYARELTFFVTQLREKKQREVHGALAKRISKTLTQLSTDRETLLPVDIAIDNHISDDYTVLRIDAPDAIGFLFELTNALALNGIYIARVVISSLGQRVHDTLFVTDLHGNKIKDPARQHYLRVATALVQHFTHLLPHSPNPESALLHFGELVTTLFSNPEWPKELASIERPDILDALAKLLGVSDFLWNDFLRVQHDNLFPVLKDVDTLAKAKNKNVLQEELSHLLQNTDSVENAKSRLNAFKDREMFRIDMRYINGLVPEFKHFTEELSDLAEITVEAGILICLEDLTDRYGLPELEDGASCRFSICGLGKFGGREVGVASDLELILIYEGRGQTDGEDRITNAEFFEKLVHQFRKTIAAKQAGIFEIDLRLRPYGRAGNVAVRFDSFQKYYAPKGPAWDYERQALVKLRPISGEEDFCRQITDARDRVLYQPSSVSIAAIRAIRERQVRQLVEGGTVNAKFSPGGLVDLEYLVQGLQLKHGSQLQDLRVSNTTEALESLAKHDILSAEHFDRLSEAHLFLRKLIEGLRIVRGNAKDLTVPRIDSQGFAFLARRLDYADDASLLHDHLMKHLSIVHELSHKLLD